MTPTERASRVLLLSNHDRVLLVGSLNPTPAKPTVWVAPGGTAEHDETPRQTAARELLEEVGIAVPPTDLIGPIGISEGPHRRVTYFTLPVDDELIPTVVNPDPAELAVWVGFRWFSADDLDATTDVVWPSELADVLRSGVLRARHRRPPAPPLTFVWSPG